MNQTESSSDTGKDDKVACSFCKKTRFEVKKLIASPKPDVYICESCVDVCHSLIHADDG